ncbi:endo alpha-1,4 polygalactosaminidase [Streptomyces montanisoli]|uniref:Endo alpha-1,4 polygalactosaminidase n=1 Tax=Streptomyces montanisoli TaxID=2798581 RepID=A0A940MLS8_9ACTN|nr:endo alpha-1,4 polygalactosaminidase [Streptomyces montanisoli]MBP0462207.1 endo alpha-1,4 polygalactosaminidase [Streptomyces montanisoli]
MRAHRVLSRRSLTMSAAAALAVVTPLVACSTAGASTTAGAAAPTSASTAAASTSAASTSAASTGVTLPPVHAGFDYQIGGAYKPPAGVKVVSRDHSASPAAGLYNICYVNAFQAQEGAEGDWDSDLLLRDANGKVVYDDGWDEAVLDIRTAAKRKRIAAKVDGWIDSCASKGFQAVEPDNFDTFTRFPKLLTSNEAEAFIKLLSDHAHAKGLAIAQKNTSELAGDHASNGLDFAVAEECGRYDECGVYTSAYGDHVIAIEYTASGLKKTCSGYGDRISVVRRDVDVSPIGSDGYLRQTC